MTKPELLQLRIYLDKQAAPALVDTTTPIIKQTDYEKLMADFLGGTDDRIAALTLMAAQINQLTAEVHAQRPVTLPGYLAPDHIASTRKIIINKIGELRHQRHSAKNQETGQTIRAQNARLKGKHAKAEEFTAAAAARRETKQAVAKEKEALLLVLRALELFQKQS